MGRHWGFEMVKESQVQLGKRPDEAGGVSREAFSLGLAMSLGQLQTLLEPSVSSSATGQLSSTSPSQRAVVRIKSVNVSENVHSYETPSLLLFCREIGKSCSVWMLTDCLTVDRTGEAELKSQS